MCDSRQTYSQSSFAPGSPPRWSWQIDQLATGLLDVRRAALRLGDWRIASIAVNSAVLHRISAGSDTPLVLCPLPGPSATYVDGCRLSAGDALLLQHGAEVELLMHGAGCVYAVELDHDSTDSVTAGSRAPQARVLTDCFDSGLIEALREWQERADDARSCAEAGALRARLRAALRASAECFAPQPPRPAVPRRRMAVERARRFIHEHLSESITLAELCRHAHLQARSLEYGFRDVVGMSPIKYVKMLRLGEVRRRLQASRADECSVSEIALDCGFCHLSQFAVDYKKMFLESPSATRRAFAGGWLTRTRSRRPGQGAGEPLFAVS